MSDTFRCPYPDCDWEPSRPIDSDARLTQAVVQHEIKSHREEHTGAEAIAVSERHTCPECGNESELKFWIFDEEDIDKGIILRCPSCKERIPQRSLQTDTERENQEESA